MVLNMSLGHWIVALVFVLPMLAALGYALFEGSFVRIPPGRLGLLLVKGRSTDKVLEPGAHWVPALRKRMAVQYPALEQAYRAGGPESASAGPDEASGPALRVTLGDRADATICYTVRFRLDRQQLRLIHQRVGPAGIWGLARDVSGKSVTRVLNDPAHGIDDLFGQARVGLQEELTTALSADFAAAGLEVTEFSLGAVDLGRNGEVIQATVRARLELEREQAEAATRMLRVRHDAELAPYLTGSSEAALRYRQNDVWRDFAARPEALTIAMAGPVPGQTNSDGEPAQPPQPGTQQ
jgi:regulator of protease activity HflC (stomatin/prohibitin superfamily)